jgi:hypothetical protein
MAIAVDNSQTQIKGCKSEWKNTLKETLFQACFCNGSREAFNMAFPQGNYFLRQSVSTFLYKDNSSISRL